MRPVRIISRKGRGCLGPVMGRPKGPRNPQRPYARPAGGTCGKIWSDLCGDIQRPAEMIGPSGNSIWPYPLVGEGYGRDSESNKMPKVAKSLVG